jgi:hypothetical protein
MLDVHPPEHGIHGVRDFFIHLLTITVGLLIALGLEQAAEAMHHRHQREHAEAAIRQEIRDNLEAVATAQTVLKREMGDLIYVLNYADARLNDKPADASKINLGLSEGQLKDAAWRTAAASGVVAYMDYGTAETFAACYKEQEEFDLMQERMLDGYLSVESFGAVKKPEDLSKEDLRAAMPVIRKTLADMRGASDVGRGLTTICGDALK